MTADTLDRRSVVMRYGLALLLVGIAWLVTWISQQFGLTNRSAAFLAAILLTGWYAGTRPMILALVLSTFVFDFFFLPPLYTLGLQRGPDPYLIWFLVFGCLGGWFSATRRRNLRLLEEARSELEARVSARTAELRRSEAYLVAAQELSHTGNWSRRLGTGEVSWSDETYRIFGLDSTTPAPRQEQILELCHPAYREQLAEAWESAVRESRGFDLDFRIVRPDGTTRFVHSKAQPVLDDAGAVIEFMGVIMDVTERKRAEQALRRARERTLETRFGAMLSERTRLAREIHDTLLQGFTGVGLQLLAVANRVGEPATAASLREVLGLAQKTLEDARRAVWDMRSPSPAGEHVSDALRIAVEERTHGAGLTLEFEVSGLPRPMDPEVEAGVFRIVQEAIANTVKHSAARTLRVQCTYGTRRVRLSIADDGIGFAVDPDFRSYGGHWGLLGMRERASQIGARVKVRSTPGHGTEVVLLAPYALRRRRRPPIPAVEVP